MRLYCEVVRTTSRRMATYRGATVAGVFTNTVFGFILSYVLLAVFRERTTIGGFDAVDAVTFTFVVQGMFVITGVSAADPEMAERIRSGEVAMDLCRPYDYQGWWAAVAYGRASFFLWARGVPPFLAGALFLEVRLPDEAWQWPAYAASLVLAVGIAFAWGFLLQLSAFWLVDVRGPNQIGWLLAQFLAGAFVPLFLFPEALERVARVLPFASMIQLPVEVFLGKHAGSDLALIYAGQVTWLVALVALGRWVLARAVRKVVIHGG
ncbi:MAG: ABC transporter permease [Acidimicrobiales bacterium]